MTIQTPLTLATVHPDTGLRAALGQAPAEVVEEVARSGIRGRGGAGFRTGLKWRLASEAPAPDGRRHVVCNADAVSYTHLRAHETRHDLVCRLLLEKKKTE